MDFNDTPEEAKFRADVRAWLEKTVPAKGGAAPRVEVTAEDREGLKAAKAYQAKKAEAGYVGLPQGQIYSAIKAGVINLAESLRAELAPEVDVRLISPGFVDTRLTQKNDFDMPALIQPEDAAAAIVKGLDKGGFELHFPRRLTLPLKFLRALPYGLALRLTRRLVR